MNPPSRPLQVLLVEDSDNDATLLELALQRSGFHCTCERVETARGLTAALDRREWDVIIADYVMPSFDGLSALAMVKQRGLDLPFIVVSGHITDDTAVAAMKAGAHDYVMKDNLARLGPAVERELREAEMRRVRRQTEARLREEHAFREAIETSIPSGIAVVNLDGRQTYVNPAFCRMVGWSDAELVGAKPPFAYWPEEEVDAITTALARVVTHGTPQGGMELRFRRKNGERFNVFMLVTPLSDTHGNVSGWLSSITDITRLKEAEGALRKSHLELERRVRERTADLSAANAKLQEAMAERSRLEHELLDITERERRRIGLDLHDDLGQRLSGIALLAKGLQLRLEKQRSAGAREAAEIYGLLQQAMSHTRNVAQDLATLEFEAKDLPSALRDLAARAREAFQIPCRFEARGDLPALDPKAVRQLYKIAQEALTNAIKHGKASQATITLSNAAGGLVLTVRNKGVSFPSVIGQSAGMGLRIMNYRAKLIGASLRIEPGLRGNGTVVTCSVAPVQGR